MHQPDETLHPENERAIDRDPAKNDKLILVDALDRPLGAATKLDAHVNDQLHRAFSVVLVREGEQEPEILLAKRSAFKYHSAGLWANTCCSHPREGESTLDAAYTRVHEELGCEAVNLREIAAFVYHAAFDNGIFEHEFDHVIVGSFSGELNLDPYEVEYTRWVTFDQLATELAQEPNKFSVWAPIALSLAMQELLQS